MAPFATWGDNHFYGGVGIAILFFYFTYDIYLLINKRFRYSLIIIGLKVLWMVTIMNELHMSISNANALWPITFIICLIVDYITAKKH